MISKAIRKQYSRQLEYFQSQIPLGTQANLILTSTVDHYHQIISDIEKVTKEDLSRFRIPETVRWSGKYVTDGVRDRLGSLIGYLKSEIEEEKEEGLPIH